MSKMCRCPGLAVRHVKPIGLAVEVDFERNARLDRREVEHLCDVEILLLRVPGRRPQRAAEHVGDIGDRRIGARNEQDFDRRFARRATACSRPCTTRAPCRCWPRSTVMVSPASPRSVARTVLVTSTRSMPS